MPRANEGTLLENIVLLETARLMISQTKAGLIEFANSFVMPPVSEWRSKASDKGMTPLAFERIASATGEATKYSSLMQLVMRKHPSRGPNGALLVCLLMALNNRNGRFWLNDIEGDEQMRYKQEEFAVGDLISAALSILGKPVPDLDIATCDQFFPTSLTNLRSTLQQWNQQQTAAGRMGYLDPDFYSPTGRTADSPQTDSDSVRLFLRVLSEGFAGPIGSVHFTCNQMKGKLAKQVDGLLSDGKSEGYGACVFSHRRFSVVVHFRNVTANFSASLKQLVENAWMDWGRTALRRSRPYKLTVRSEVSEVEV